MKQAGVGLLSYFENEALRSSVSVSPQNVASGPRADYCAAQRDVCFVPISENGVHEKPDGISC